jgi:tyrosine decarboxylase / aspartate 1-decarboxylase
MKLDIEALKILEKALSTLEQGFVDLPDIETKNHSGELQSVLEKTAERLADNYPYFHPLYAGQMLKPPHPIARLAYMLAMYINPNNHALDGGRASSQMEKEAVSELAAMFGWDSHLGHLTSGGTMANLEALWIAGQIYPGKKIVASEQAHYTHKRISDVLKLDIIEVPCSLQAQMDLNALEDILKKEKVGTVVATVGTTGTGSVDPVKDILTLQKQYGFRIHVDAAYGGYYTLSNNLLPSTKAHFNELENVDSIVIDPHKHGLQPYGCGCILFKDPSVGSYYKHESPYTYFSSSELHLGEISLECSRAGASAVALWATQQLLPMEKGGEFAQDLEKCREAAKKLFRKISRDDRFLIIMAPELDIVVWAPRGNTASEISQKSQQIFKKAAEQNLHLATFSYPSKQLEPLWPDVEFDQENVTCLRSCLIKPEHVEWVDKIWNILDEISK